MSEATENPTASPEESGTALEEFQAKEIMRLTDLKDRLESQIKEKEQQYTRLFADFDNFRRRTTTERDKIKTDAVGSTAKELLGVLDNFERAKSQIQIETEREEAINGSYQTVYKQCLTIFEKLGVVPIVALEQPFDPQLHEAIAQEDSEQYNQETVIAEFQKGYYLGDKVLRHVLVKVATPVTPLATDTENSVT
jgi:molecular chaperone GrpE